MKNVIITISVLIIACVTQAQDSVSFIPVFYKQCNTDLIKTDSVDIRIEYKVYRNEEDVVSVSYHKLNYSIIPGEIKIPAEASHFELYINELLQLEPNPDSSGIWRDTFYLQNTERYFFNTIRYMECGQVLNGTIKRLSIHGKVEEIVTYDNGELVGKTTYHDNGNIASESRGLNRFDENYSIRQYNPNGNLIYQQNADSTVLYSYDGVKLVEIYHPLYTKKGIKKYRKKVNRHYAKKLRYKGKKTKNASELYQPCYAKTYFEKTGNMHYEGEYLVKMSVLTDMMVRLADLLLIQNNRWGQNYIPLWVKEYDNTGNFIYLIK